jgi:rhamnose transport system permease protein
MASVSNSLDRQETSDLGLKLSRFREIGIIVFLIAVIGITLFFRPNFLSPINIRSILLWIPLLVIIACGEMMVIITRGIDVSVGSTLAFSGIVVGMIFRDNPDFNIFLGVLLGILLGRPWGRLTAC